MCNKEKIPRGEEKILNIKKYILKKLRKKVGQTTSWNSQYHIKYLNVSEFLRFIFRLIKKNLLQDTFREKAGTA